MARIRRKQKTSPQRFWVISIAFAVLIVILFVVIGNANDAQQTLAYYSSSSSLLTVNNKDTTGGASSGTATAVAKTTTTTTAAVVPQCTTDQLDQIYTTFYTPPVKRGATPLYKATNCPNEAWLDEYMWQDDPNVVATRTASLNLDFLAVNVGCNKGEDAVEMARWLARRPEFTAKTWKSTLNWQAPRGACGKPRDAAVPTGLATRKGHVHCLEAVPSTFEELTRTTRQLNWNDTIKVRHGAFSNATGGTILFPDAHSGTEAYSLGNCFTSNSHENVAQGVAEGGINCTAVPLKTLDAYLLEFYGGVWPAVLDLLLIDVEGFDFEVLQGSRQALQRTRYVAFEVHSQGLWPTHLLVKEAIQEILSDFVCYWNGRNRLWRISNCVDDRLTELYETTKAWSNVACVRRTETALLKKMEAVFQRTLEETKPKKE